MVQHGAFHYRSLERAEVVNGCRFATCSCYNRLPLFGNDQVKDLFEARLAKVCIDHNVRLISWVLMPEHFHLLLVPNVPTSPMRTVLHALKSPFARQVLARWRTLKATVLPRLRDENGAYQFWLPGGGHDRNIFSNDELFEKHNYIHQNPVRRGLVSRAADWKWSSARWYAGDTTSSVPIWDYTLRF